MTTRCDLPGCLMCPRSAWPERWLHQDLSWQNFERLIPALKFFKHIHLSGWGEPLLHPHLWDMAQAARSQGCTVSLTTNGMNLTEAMQVQVLKHLDMVAVSLDGARAETFERLRPGADFQRVTQQIAALCSRKRTLGTQRPEVVLLFMKMRPNVAELPDFLRLAAALGVDRVNATNLDFIAAPAMEGLTLVPSAPDPEIAAIFEQTQRQAEKFCLPFRNVGSTPVSDLIVCDANPLKNIFVTAAGDLSPCVYLGLPVAGTFSRHFFQKSYSAQNYCYGNTIAQEFSEILHQPSYQEFTAFFHNRVSTSSRLMDNLVPNPQAPIRQDGGGKNPPIAEPLLPLPQACQGCYKSLGF
ncbi:MAG: radical SAM/SPASM domain-containing protein [Deltaproteobacteria bacterium]|nr:radical SAM/SPASM domain-containing protein [Deltaproteobacteria bacterium]